MEVGIRIELITVVQCYGVAVHPLTIRATDQLFVIVKHTLRYAVQFRVRSPVERMCLTITARIFQHLLGVFIL